jgi:hypothetical protein
MKGEICTRERGQHTKISKPQLREQKAGHDGVYGVQDVWHCALDYMLDKGFIELDQYDAGYELRRLYYTFTRTGRWIEEGGKANDPEVETEGDIAFSQFNAALRGVDRMDRNVTRAVCVEITTIPADYMLIQQIKSGLNDLYKHFRGNK